MTKKTTKINPAVYKQITEGTNCIILLLDSKFNIKFLNKSAKDLFGFEEKEIIGFNIRGLITLKKDIGFLNNLKKILKEPASTQGKINFEYKNIDKQKNKLRILWNCSRVHDKKNKSDDIICIGIIGDQGGPPEILVTREEREKIAISERSQLARELHDTVSQNIYSTSLIAEVLPKIWEKDRKEGHKRLEEIRQLTRGALSEMRMLLLELKPSTFTDEDLESLVKQLSRSIEIRTGIPVKVKIEGKYILPLRDRLALYRIAQEALNNVAKHSSATMVNILLQYLPGSMNFIIEDNGRGFDKYCILPDNLGLEIMKERARSIGASIIIKSKTGIGTRISVSYKKIKA